MPFRQPPRPSNRSMGQPASLRSRYSPFIFDDIAKFLKIIRQIFCLFPFFFHFLFVLFQMHLLEVAMMYIELYGVDRRSTTY
jgi:hypothetical protein